MSYSVSVQVIQHETGRTVAYVNLYEYDQESDEGVMLRGWSWSLGPNEGMPRDGEDFLVEGLGTVIGHIAGE